jgi:signal transduction histidine kinase
MTDLMVSNVTHEYLTPVRCIYNLTLILEKSVHHPQDRKHITTIQTTSKLLLAQINTTLDGSLINQNHFQPVYSV